MTTTDTQTEAVEESTETEVTEEAPDAEDTQPETRDQDHLEQLRQETQRADALAQRLHATLVGATGKLADPTDLPFNADHLEDPDKLGAAIDELLARKPHLASRRPVGDIGQGARPTTAAFSLLDALKEHT